MNELTIRDLRFVSFAAIFAASALVLYDFILEIYCKFLYVGHHDFRQFFMLLFIVFIACVNVFIVEPVNKKEEAKISFRKRWSRSGPLLAVALLVIESLLDDALGSPKQMIVWCVIVAFISGISFVNLRYAGMKGLKPWALTVSTGMLLGAPLALRATVLEADIPAYLAVIVATTSGACCSVLMRILLQTRMSISPGVKVGIAAIGEALLFSAVLRVCLHQSGYSIDLDNHIFHLWGQSAALALGWGLAVDSHAETDQILARVRGIDDSASDPAASLWTDRLAIAFFALMLFSSVILINKDAHTISDKEIEKIKKIDALETEISIEELEN